MIELSVRENEFAGVFQTGTVHKDKVIIRVGGSGAPKDRVIASGKFLVDAGYSVMFLGYYLWEDQPKIVSEIPIDYVEKAVKWIKEYTHDPNTKIGMTGISQGAQYTLAAASLIPDISSIAVASPFDYVMEGNTPSFGRTGHSTYTYHENELPYTPWELLGKNKLKLFFDLKSDKNYGLGRMMRYGYDKNGVDERSGIAVENMHANVLLLASRNDDCWPSDEAVVRIENRLKSADYPYIVESHIYEKGCHNMGGNMDIDSRQGKKLKKLMRAWSDHPEECRKCIADSMERIVDFFDRTL